MLQRTRGIWRLPRLGEEWGISSTDIRLPPLPPGVPFQDVYQVSQHPMALFLMLARFGVAVSCITCALFGTRCLRGIGHCQTFQSKLLKGPILHNYPRRSLHPVYMCTSTL